MTAQVQKLPQGDNRNPNWHANLRPRGKGVKNKFTVQVKEAFEYAFTEIGGAEALANWARSHRSEFYTLYAKMLPAQTKVDVSVTIGLNERLMRARERIDPRIASIAGKIIEADTE